MENHFETGIANLRQKLLVMASHTEKSVNNAVQSLMQRNHDLALRVKAEDDVIDHCEVEIDELAIQLLTKAPLATNLRLVTVAMKISQDLERIGDEATKIAKRARGTPRIANRLLRRVRDYAEVKGTGTITKAMADAALKMLDVDPSGFDVMDRKLLEAILHKFDGGPVGIDNLAAAIGEERDTIEDVLEPYLIQQGYLQRTSRGRVATRQAYEHFGLTPPSGSASLDI